MLSVVNQMAAKKTIASLSFNNSIVTTSGQGRAGHGGIGVHGRAKHAPVGIGIAFVQAQRIIMKRTTPASSMNFTSDGYFSTNTLRIRAILSRKNGSKTGSPLGRSLPLSHSVRERYRGACCRSITNAIART
jgi:hypothetical protein